MYYSTYVMPVRSVENTVEDSHTPFYILQNNLQVIIRFSINSRNILFQFTVLQNWLKEFTILSQKQQFLKDLWRLQMVQYIQYADYVYTCILPLYHIVTYL